MRWRGLFPFSLSKVILASTPLPPQRKTQTYLHTHIHAKHNPPVVLEEAQRPPVQVQLHAHDVARPKRLRVPSPLRLPLVAACMFPPWMESVVSCGSLIDACMYAAMTIFRTHGA